MKRYEITPFYDALDIEEDKCGDWVRYEDAAKLEAENQRLRDAIRHAVDGFKDKSYDDDGSWVYSDLFYELENSMNHLEES